MVCAIKAQQSMVTAPDTDEARKALDILRASIAGYFTRQKTRLKKARQDIKVFNAHCCCKAFIWKKKIAFLCVYI